MPSKRSATKDPETILVERAAWESSQQEQQRADAENRRRNRLYKVCLAIARYDPATYVSANKTGVPDLMDEAKLLVEDRWWPDVERILGSGDDSHRTYALHILRAARDGNEERVLELLQRGKGLGEWYLGLGLYRELVGIGWGIMSFPLQPMQEDLTAGDTTEPPIAGASEQPATAMPYTLREPHWLVCGDKPIKVGDTQYRLLRIMEGTQKKLREDVETDLGVDQLHRVIFGLNQLLAKNELAFHFRVGRDGYMRLVHTPYQKTNRSRKSGRKSRKSKSN